MEVCEVLIEFVYHRAEEDAEDGCGEAFPLEHTLCDGE